MSMELEGVSSSFELVLKGAEKASKQLDDFIEQISQLESIEIGKKGVKLDLSEAKRQLTALKKEVTAGYKEIASFKLDTKDVFAEGQAVGASLADGIKRAAKERLDDVLKYVENVSRTLSDTMQLASGKSASPAALEGFQRTVAGISTELRTMRTMLTGASTEVQALAGSGVSEFERLKTHLTQISKVMKEYKGSAGDGKSVVDTSSITNQVDRALVAMDTLDAKTSSTFADIQSKLSRVAEPKELSFEQVGQAIVSNINNAFSKASAVARGAIKEINEAVEGLTLGDKMAAQILSPKVANAMAKLRDNITALQERSQELANLQERANAATSDTDRKASTEAIKKELVTVEALARKVAQANMNVSNEFFATQRSLLTTMQASASQLGTDFNANAAAVQRIADNTMRFKQGIGDSLTKLGLGVDVLKQQESINSSILAIVRAGGEAEAGAVAEMVRGTNAYKQTMIYAEKLQTAETAIASSRLSGNQALQMANTLLKEQVSAYKQASIIGVGNDAVVAFDKMVEASKRLSANNAGIKLREDIASMTQTIAAGGVPAVDSLTRSITLFETNSGRAFSDQKAEIKMVKTLVDQLAKQYTALGTSATTAAKSQQQKVADLVGSISSTMLDQGLGKADTKVFETAQRMAEVNKENLAIDQLRVKFQTDLIDQFTKVYALQVAGVDVAKNYGRMEELYIQAKRQGLELEDKLIARIKDRSGVMTKLASEVAGMKQGVNDSFIFPEGQVAQLKAIVDTLGLMQKLRASMDKKGEAATVVDGETLDVSALERETRLAQELLRTKEAEVNQSKEGERVYAAINAILDKRKALEQGIIESLKVAKEMNTNTLGAYDRYISMADALVTTTQKGIPVGKELLDIDRARELAVRELYTEYARLEKARIENKGGPQEGLLALQREKELLSKLASIVDRDYKFKLETGPAEVGISNITKLIQGVESKLSKLDQLWKTQDKLFGKSDPEALRSLAQTVQNIRAAMQDLAPTLATSGQGYNSMLDAVMRSDIALGKYTSKLKSLYTEELANASSTAKQREETLAVTAAMEREMAVIKGLQGALNGADSKLRAVGSSMTEATTDPQALAEKLAGDPTKLASVQAAMQRIMEAMQAMSATKLTKGSVLEALNAEAQQFAGKVASIVDALKTISTTAGKVDLTKVNVTPEQAAAGREAQEQNILRSIEKQYQELMQGVNVLDNWLAIQKNIVEATRQGYSLGQQNVSVLTAQEDVYKQMYATAQSLYATAASNESGLPQAARNAALEQSLKLYTAIRDAAANMPAGNFAAGMDLTKVIADAERLREEFGTNIPSALQKLIDEGARLGDVLQRAVTVASTSNAPSGFSALRKEIDTVVTSLNTLKGNTADTTAYSTAQESVGKVVQALQQWRGEQEQLNTKDGVVSAEFQKTAATIDNIVGRMQNWVEKNNELRASGMDTEYDGAKQDIAGIIQALQQWGGQQANIFDAAKAGTVFEKTATSMDLILTHLKDWKNIQEQIYNEQAKSGQDISGLQSQREKVREAERLLGLMQQMRAISEKISVKSASVGVDSGSLGTVAGVAALASATKETPKIYLDIAKASQEYKGLLATIEKSIGSSTTLQEVFKGYAPTLATAKSEVDKVNNELSKYAASKARAASNTAGQSMFDVTRMSWFMQLRAFWSMYMGVTQTITSVVEYTHTLNIMKAVTESSIKTTQELDKTFMSLGRNVPIATTKIAEAALQVAKAGMSAEETVNIINAATSLAHATKADITMVADVLTVAHTAWGISTKKSGEIADMMFTAMSRSRADMEGMNQAMGYLSGIAPQANVGIKETLGLLGVLTNAGLSMSKAATYSRQVLNDLMNPSTKLVNILGTLGVKLRDVDPRFNSLSTIFQRLADAGMNVSQAFEGMSVRGANAFSVALSNADKLEEFTESLEGNGALLREYAGTTQDIASQFTLLMNAFTELGNSVKNGTGQFLMGMIDGVRESIYGLIALFNMMSTALGALGIPMRSVGNLFAKLVLVMGTGVVILKVAGYMSMLSAKLLGAGTATTVFATAWRAMLVFMSAHPILAAIAALGTLTAMLTMSSSSTSDAISDMAEKVAQLREEINKLNKMKLQTSADVNIMQRTGAFKEAAKDPRLETEAGRANVGASFRGVLNTIMQSASDDGKEIGKNLLAAMPSEKDGKEVWQKFFANAYKEIEKIRGEAAGLVADVTVQQKDIIEKARSYSRTIVNTLSSDDTSDTLTGLREEYQRKTPDMRWFKKREWSAGLSILGESEGTGEAYAEKLKDVAQSVSQLNEMIDGMGRTKEAKDFVESLAASYEKLGAKLRATRKELNDTGRTAPKTLIDLIYGVDKVLEKRDKLRDQKPPTVDEQGAQTLASMDNVDDKSRAKNRMDELQDIITALKDVNTQAANLKSVADIGMLSGSTMDGAREKIYRVGEELGKVMARVAESHNTLATLPAEDAKNVVDAVKSIWGSLHEQMLLGANEAGVTYDGLVAKVRSLAKMLKLNPSGLGKLLKISGEGLKTLRNQTREGGLDSYDDLQSKIRIAAGTKNSMTSSDMAQTGDIQAVDEVLASLIKTQFAFIKSMLKTKYAVESAKASYGTLEMSIAELRAQFGDKLDTNDFTDPVFNMANLLDSTFYSVRTDVQKTIMSVNELKDNIITTDAEYGRLGAITGKNEKQARGYLSEYANHAQGVASQMTSMQSKIEASYKSVEAIHAKMRALRTTMLADDAEFLAKTKAISDSVRSPNDRMKISQENISKQSMDVAVRMGEAGLSGEDLESAIRTLRDGFLGMADTFKFDRESTKYAGQANEMQAMLSSLQKTRMEKLALEKQMADLQQAMQLEIYKSLQSVMERLLIVLGDLDKKITGYDKSIPTGATGGLSSGVNFGTVTKANKDMLRAIMMAESGGNPYAVSPKGARGQMQVMPGTISDPGYGVRPAKDESASELTRVGQDYFKAMLKEFKGDVVQALAAYNWGPGNVESLLKRMGVGKGDTSKDEEIIARMPQETQDYIEKIYGWLAQRGKLPESKQAAAAKVAAKTATAKPGETAPAASVAPVVAATEDTTTEMNNIAKKMADIRDQAAKNDAKMSEANEKYRKQLEEVDKQLNANAQEAGTASAALSKFALSLGSTADIAVNTASGMFTSIKDALASSLTEATKSLVDGSGDIDQVFTNLYWSLVDAYYKMLMDMLMRTAAEELLGATAKAGESVADAAIRQQTAAQQVAAANAQAAAASTNTGNTTTFTNAVAMFGGFIDKMALTFGFKTPTDVLGDTTEQVGEVAGDVVETGAEATLQATATAAITTTGTTAATGIQGAMTAGQAALTAAQSAATLAIQSTEMVSQGSINATGGVAQAAIQAMLSEAILSIQTVAQTAQMSAMIPGSHEGGIQVPGFSIGGYTAGGNVTQGNRQKDSMLAALTKGEFVVQEPVVRSLGVEFFKDLNSGRAQDAFERLPGIQSPTNAKGYSPPTSAATVAKTGQAGASSGKPSVSINNLVDPKVVERYLATDRGKTTIRNVVSQHPYFKK